MVKILEEAGKKIWAMGYKDGEGAKGRALPAKTRFGFQHCTPSAHRSIHQSWRPFSDTLITVRRAECFADPERCQAAYTVSAIAKYSESYTVLRHRTLYWFFLLYFSFFLFSFFFFFFTLGIPRLSRLSNQIKQKPNLKQIVYPF